MPRPVICTTPYLRSSVRGVDYSDLAFYTPILDTLVTSTKDGKVEHTPDPLPIIQSRMNFTNTSSVDRALILEIKRPARSITTENTNMLRLRDALSWSFGETALALEPSFQSDYGSAALRIKKTPFAYRKTLEYIRMTYQWGGSDLLVPLGTLKAGDTSDIRYECLLDTPGEFREWEKGLYSVSALYARVVLWGLRV